MSSLLDRFERPLGDLRISVIDRCNFRCPYCMPASVFGDDYDFIPPSSRLGDDEIERLARLFVDLGVRKLRITGGEPLIRRGIAGLVERLARIDAVEDLALTTNGVLLPQHARALREAGLGRLTVSVDSLDPEVFSRLSGGKGTIAQVLEGIRAAEDAGFDQMKINTVVKRGFNDHTVLALLEHFRNTRHIVRFIEYMDVGTCNGWRKDEVVSSAELRDRIHQRWPLEPLQARYYGEVANRYAYRDGGGEIGFVSSVSQPFCGSCTRARLSSAGVLYTCLFAQHGMDLMTPLRDGADDAELMERVRQRWGRRGDRYSEERGEQQTLKVKVEMYRVGG